LTNHIKSTTIKIDDISGGDIQKYDIQVIDIGVTGMNKFSPLTESMYYILVSLIEPLHGYGIIKKVEEMSSSRVKLAAGTLYGALTNLERNKLIIATGIDPDNKRRKLYQITDLGIDVLNDEIRRLEEMILNGRGVLND